MSTTTRPKPRPRARARAPAATETNANVRPASSPGPSSAASTSQPAQSAPALSTIEDEDALFLRNRTRSAQAWAQISKMTKEQETRKRRSSSDSSDDDNHGSSPRSRHRKKRSQKKTDDLPDWTKKKPDEIVLSSDSDSDIILEGQSSKAATNGRNESSQRKSKRPRSRSITPPPALPQYAIERAREAVQQLVGTLPRAPSPTDFADESTDNIILDPELALIAQRVRSEARHEAVPVVESGGPEQVLIRVVWKPHPLDPNCQSDSWDITQKRHDAFFALFDEVADLASIRNENLVICYEGKRIFPSSNPHGIGIWAEAELEACDKATYQYLQELRRMRSPSVAPFAGHTGRSPERARSPSVTELSDSDSAGGGSAKDNDEQSNAFHLTVRSERTKEKDISLLVRPTTKCGAIVRAFLKKAGLEADYPADGVPAKGRGRGKAIAKIPALSVDGDRMAPDAEIGEADLEDGDLVEIVGL